MLLARLGRANNHFIKKAMEHIYNNIQFNYMHPFNFSQIIGNEPRTVCAWKKLNINTILVITQT
mgnify:CR=1 FL=1